MPLGVGSGRVRRMAATRTLWRAWEGGSTWTPARPSLGLGAHVDPGPEANSLFQLDETSPHPDNDGQRPQWAQKVSRAPVDDGQNISWSLGGWPSFYQDLDVRR